MFYIYLGPLNGLRVSYVDMYTIFFIYPKNSCLAWLCLLESLWLDGQITIDG